MWSSGKPFLCCGKSNRQRCVPLTSWIHASALASSASTRVPTTEIPAAAAAAAPAIFPRKPRRCVFASEYTGNSFLQMCARYMAAADARCSGTTCLTGDIANRRRKTTPRAGIGGWGLGGLGGGGGSLTPLTPQNTPLTTHHPPTPPTPNPKSPPPPRAAASAASLHPLEAAGREPGEQRAD